MNKLDEKPEVDIESVLTGLGGGFGTVVSNNPSKAALAGEMQKTTFNTISNVL